jgi:hypothetical protein
MLVLFDNGTPRTLARFLTGRTISCVIMKPERNSSNSTAAIPAAPVFRVVGQFAYAVT